MTGQELIKLLEHNHLTEDILAKKLVKTLREKGLKIATAESCTGGLVSSMITSVSGASEVFDCGVCSYSNRIKHQLLGVKDETLSTFGAVSEETAKEMAAGVRRLSSSDIGISTTGIAGPTGGTTEKPVGLVYVGVSARDTLFAVRLMLSDVADSREEVRRLAVLAALYHALKEAGKAS